MYLKVYSEGHHHQIIHKIMYHKKDTSTIDKSYGFKRIRNGKIVPKMTTHEWKILVEWKYGSSYCIYFNYLKVSSPIELAENSVGNKIDDEK